MSRALKTAQAILHTLTQSLMVSVYFFVCTLGLFALIAL